MTLDEAIAYAEKVAKDNREEYGLCPCPSAECDGQSDCRCLGNGKGKGCLKCAQEQEQLAEWLKELKAVHDEIDDADNEDEIFIGYLRKKMRVANREAIKIKKTDDVPDTNVGDMISRQAAVDAIYAVINPDASWVAKLILGNVERLPSAQPEQQWIPCSERLPERYGWYLCTLKDGRVNCYYWNNKGEWVDNGKKHFFDLYNIRSRYTGEEINPEQEGSVYWTDWVIAWMPLPEPYKEGDSDERS